MSIKSVEAFLIAQITGWVRPHIRAAKTLPGDWDDDMLKRFASELPGVWLAWAGGTPTPDGSGVELTLSSGFVVYVSTGHATEEMRRVGHATQIGAYDLVQMLVPKLHGLVVPDEGSYKVAAVENLFTGSVERQALTLYAITLTGPLTFKLVPEASELGDFKSLDARFDIPPHTPDQHPGWLANPEQGNPDARDVVSLPQT
jgi:phage gp37-like protein